MKDYPKLKVQKGVIVQGGSEILSLADHVVGIPWNSYFKNPIQQKRAQISLTIKFSPITKRFFKVGFSMSFMA